ncbi:MAG: hypothetical protein IPM69_05760 [Ignavibacteria bacterium]|nr:hypothetical protein [Ignavibacteria bacterium]
MKLELPDHIRTFIEDSCAENSVVCLRIVLRGSPQKILLDVFIDSAEGITHDNCKNISKALNELSETDDFLSKVSLIEVSSPGADEPLTYIWQYTKHINRTFKCLLSDKSSITGKLIATDEHSITIEEKPLKMKDGKIPVERTIPIQSIEKSTVVLSFK